MKKARLLLPLFLLFVIPVTGQVEHAATPEQCRADSDNWSLPKAGVFIPNEDQFSNLTTAMIHAPRVTAKMLEARIAELQQCVKTDNVQATRYAEGQRAYGLAELARMGDFIQRNSLTGQFYDEDDQGKR